MSTEQDWIIALEKENKKLRERIVELESCVKEWIQRWSDASPEDTDWI